MYRDLMKENEVISEFVHSLKSAVAGDQTWVSGVTGGDLVASLLETLFGNKVPAFHMFSLIEGVWNPFAVTF